MCQSEILSDPGSFRRARAAIRMLAGRMPLLKAMCVCGGGGSPTREPVSPFES